MQSLAERQRSFAAALLDPGLVGPDGKPSSRRFAVYRDEDEFKLHIFGEAYDFPLPTAFAYLDGIAEIVLPVLLFIGLATRFSALGLLVMTGVIQLVVPEGWANFHLPWAGLALAIIALGPGALSLDRLLERWPRRWEQGGS